MQDFFTTISNTLQEKSSITFLWEKDNGSTITTFFPILEPFLIIHRRLLQEHHPLQHRLHP